MGIRELDRGGYLCLAELYFLKGKELASQDNDKKANITEKTIGDL